jgi:mannose-6-phosphate isomerase-like protein (cupin superfamily)
MSNAGGTRPAGVRAVQIDNERVRVSHWSFSPEAATGWHRHEFDYVIVPLMDGALRMDDGRDRSTVRLAAGECYFRSEGVEHDVVNASGREFSFVEIELKKPSAHPG